MKVTAVSKLPQIETVDAQSVKQLTWIAGDIWAVQTCSTCNSARHILRVTSTGGATIELAFIDQDKMKQAFALLTGAAPVVTKVEEAW